MDASSGRTRDLSDYWTVSGIQYIRFSAKDTEKMIGSFTAPVSTWLLMLPSTFTNMAYYCHVWTGSALSSFSSLNSVQKYHRVLVGAKLFSTPQPISDRRDVASLSLFFHEKYSDELHSFVPPVLNFMVWAQHVTHIVANHTHFLGIPLEKITFHSNSFLSPKRNAIPDHKA